MPVLFMIIVNGKTLPPLLILTSATLVTTAIRMVLLPNRMESLSVKQESPCTMMAQKKLNTEQNSDTHELTVNGAVTAKRHVLVPNTEELYIYSRKIIHSCSACHQETAENVKKNTKQGHLWNALTNVKK